MYIFWCSDLTSIRILVQGFWDVVLHVHTYLYLLGPRFGNRDSACRLRAPMKFKDPTALRSESHYSLQLLLQLAISVPNPLIVSRTSYTDSSFEKTALPSKQVCNLATFDSYPQFQPLHTYPTIYYSIPDTNLPTHTMAPTRKIICFSGTYPGPPSPPGDHH